MRHRAREWRADHGGLRLPPFKLAGAALEAERAQLLAKVRRWAEAVESKQPEGARRLRAELGREGVELFPWRFDAAAADLQALPSAAELEHLTAKARSLVLTRCPASPDAPPAAAPHLTPKARSGTLPTPNPHQVEPLLAARDACMLRHSYHAAMLDRRALAKLGVSSQ